MSFALRVRDNTGRIRVDTGDRVGRLVHRQVLPAGVNGTVSLPGWDSTNTVIFTSRLSGLGFSFIDEGTGAHLASWTAPGTVSYSTFPPAAAQYAPSLLLVIALGDTA
jgi:hypothetical protein